ncbi:hypothetical protein [Aquamicrobium sp.]|uniref:hypothetical protein n=1 Tax=Aquamicrobium sp. TaxID=1872579 RepID=UPI002590F844|nr:hypothetical protein [Aquamicrobium sp.]MCK9551150.1 hypothetical protein [Aquamicrobium sp.]
MNNISRLVSKTANSDFIEQVACRKLLGRMSWQILENPNIRLSTLKHLLEIEKAKPNTNIIRLRRLLEHNNIDLATISEIRDIIESQQGNNFLFPSFSYIFKSRKDLTADFIDATIKFIARLDLGIFLDKNNGLLFLLDLIISHKNTSQETLDFTVNLLLDQDHHFRFGSLIVNQKLSDEVYNKYMNFIEKNSESNRDRSLLHLASTKYYEEILLNFAENSLSDDVYRAIIFHHGENGARRILKNTRALSKEILIEILSKGYCHNTMADFFHQENLDEKILWQIYNDHNDNYMFMESLAANEKLPKELFECLYSLNEYTVNKALAKNEAIPLDILWRLQFDSDQKGYGSFAIAMENINTKKLVLDIEAKGTDMQKAYIVALGYASDEFKKQMYSDKDGHFYKNFMHFGYFKEIFCDEFKINLIDKYRHEPVYSEDSMDNFRYIFLIHGSYFSSYHKIPMDILRAIYSSLPAKSQKKYSKCDFANTSDFRKNFVVLTGSYGALKEEALTKLEENLVGQR